MSARSASLLSCCFCITGLQYACFVRLNEHLNVTRARSSAVSVVETRIAAARMSCQLHMIGVNVLKRCRAHYRSHHHGSTPTVQQCVWGCDPSVCYTVSMPIAEGLLCPMMRTGAESVLLVSLQTDTTPGTGAGVLQNRLLCSCLAVQAAGEAS